ncbi:MAG: amino acid ABC transporter permease [Gammaproteobacteria bacterium]|nr:amino acid ABC transporter permease [Gammaproteobacteria bacterium]MDH3447862.1 amino acid ABC transporter permease [Gammaproteobacteria bacterium]
MNYNWDWGVLIREPYFEWLVSGFMWTISVSIAAWILAFSLGSVVGIARTTNSKILRGIGTCYVETFRNIPLLVQMFLWYFVFPELLPDDAGMWVKRELPMPEFTTAVVCLGLYTASRVAEQVRAGIEAIGQGQRNAGLAMGLTPAQVYRYVLLPVSYRIIVPPLTSEFLTIFKNSSLALTIGVLETTAQARQIEEYTFQGFEAFTAATLLYIVVTSTVMLLMKLIEGRVRIPGMISLGAK